MIHTLKLCPQYFDAVANGIKTFEVRKFDREYQIGDTLFLYEYDEYVNAPSSNRWVRCVITYIFNDPKYVEFGEVILGIKVIERGENIYEHKKYN